MPLPYCGERAAMESVSLKTEKGYSNSRDLSCGNVVQFEQSGSARLLNRGIQLSGNSLPTRELVCERCPNS